MTIPSRKIGAHVTFRPRADQRLNERYSANQVASLTKGGEWSIWADHPDLGWVWLVRLDGEGGTVFEHAAIADLDLVIRVASTVVEPTLDGGTGRE